jgi:hypothetical protein
MAQRAFRCNSDESRSPLSRRAGFKRRDSVLGGNDEKNRLAEAKAFEFSNGVPPHGKTIELLADETDTSSESGQVMHK